MNPIRIDLYSDTKTRPTPGMRRAMAEAEVGDEQSWEDPSVNRLCEQVCDLLGKEAALFLPSGTMCNIIGFAVHCRPGDEVMLHRTAHPITSEGGGPAVHAGVMLRGLEGDRGIFAPDAVRAALASPGVKRPRQRLVSIEQTSNAGGGSIWPLATVREVAAVAHEHGLAVHMDGARLLNAVVASGVSARDYAALCDSVWIDLSKGLGCPVGAVIAGSRAFIEEAWRCKHLFGGAMRQAGILAAAGLYALEHHVQRLAEDHANAQALAAGLVDIPGIVLDPPQVDTNMVFFDVAGTGFTARQLSERLAADGLRIGGGDGTRMRAVTHLDVSRDQIDEAITIVRGALREAR
ncbi:MAG TPA: threonine aldolase family protein [bacterium]|nr:threonine aldolase family protein [bacterium]